jgi:tight adherence protein C
MSPADFLPSWLSLDTVITCGAGAANVLALAVLYRAFSPREVVAARGRALARRRKELRDALISTPRPNRRQKPVGIVRTLLERLKLTGGAETRKSADSLSAAGWRSADAMTLFLGCRVGAPPVFGLLGWLLAPIVAPASGLAVQALIALAGMAAGMYAPVIFVNNAANNRRQKILKQLPDALDLFVICAEAGLGLDAAFVRVSRELTGSSHELADELGLTAIELGFLPNRRAALANLAKRVDMPAMRSLATTLTQTERYGTPLAQSLRTLSQDFRHERLMRAEQKAAKLPATLSVPMILFILPPLFVVLIGPAVIQVIGIWKH